MGQKQRVLWMNSRYVYYSLHRFDTWSFCDGGCYIVEPFVFFLFSIIMWPVLIYTLRASAFLLDIIYFYIRYPESDYRVLTKFKGVETA